MGKFKNWFFKGRIEKARIKQERIDTLSKEYDEGKVFIVEGYGYNG